jgi:hypothetical protein
MIWFIVLNTIMNDGTLYTDTRFPNSPQYNNEKSCNEAGQILADQLQLEIGTNTGKTYFICRSVSIDDLSAAVGKTGSGT